MSKFYFLSTVLKRRKKKEASFFKSGCCPKSVQPSDALIEFKTFFVPTIFVLTSVTRLGDF